MKLKFSALAIVATLVASLAVATLNKPQDIVDTAAGSKDFKTLVAAVKAEQRR